MTITTETGRSSSGPGSSVSVTDEAIVIRIGRPVPLESQTESPGALSGRARSGRAARLAFAARADGYEGLVMWHRFEAMYTLLGEYAAELEASRADLDPFMRVYDPVCQAAAAYATIAGVRQYTAEHFVEDAAACMERIPAVGRLMRDGLLRPAWFRRAVEQTMLITDPDLLAFIDGEIAHRLASIGGLTAKRVEHTVAAIVAEHDPDAATQTRDQVKANKDVLANPITDGMTQLIITATAEDAILCTDALDAVIAGVCAHDPRTKRARRSDAAVARITGVPFACQCNHDDCDATLSDADIAQRCARMVMHVIARQETLEGTAQTPALLEGYGPISPAHAREIAARPDTVHRPLDLGAVAARPTQPGNPYRPSAGLDTAVRGLFGTCSWVGCDRRAWRCDLDHVTEYNHADPAAGGATCTCNLNPKCRFHHGLKTCVSGWLDDQIVDANGIIWTEITTPEGLTVRRQAANMWLLPELGLMPCQHTDPIATRPQTRHADDVPKRATTRLQAKHRYRISRRAANRRHREAIEAEQNARYGEPPF